MKPISQREAQRLQKRVKELEERERVRRRDWCQEWFGGVEIGSFTCTDTNVTPHAIRVARKLRHAVVVVGDDGQKLRFVALPMADK